MEWLAQMALSRFGIILGLLGVLGVAVIKVLAHYFTTKIDLMRREFEGNEQARAHKLQAESNARKEEAIAAERARIAEAEERQELLAAREKDFEAMRAELKAGREKLEVLMTNHLAHDTKERENLTAALVDFKAYSQQQTQAIKDLAGEIKTATHEMARRAA